MNNQHISENKKQNEWPINAKESWLHVWKLEYANLKVDRFTDHEANLSGSIGPSATSTFSMELPADSKYLQRCSLRQWLVVTSLALLPADFWRQLQSWMKQYLRHGNKVKENEVSSYCETLRYMPIYVKHNKKQWKSWSPLCQTYKPIIISNLILKKWTYIHRPWGNWLIHSTKHHKDNQSLSLELPCGIS